jgi:hypothetical protein
MKETGIVWITFSSGERWLPVSRLERKFKNAKPLERFPELQELYDKETMSLWWYNDDGTQGYALIQKGFPPVVIAYQTLVTPK